MDKSSASTNLVTPMSRLCVSSKATRLLLAAGLYDGPFNLCREQGVVMGELGLIFGILLSYVDTARRKTSAECQITLDSSASDPSPTGTLEQHAHGCSPTSGNTATYNRNNSQCSKAVTCCGWCNHTLERYRDTIVAEDMYTHHLHWRSERLSTRCDTDTTRAQPPKRSSTIDLAFSNSDQASAVVKVHLTTGSLYHTFKARNNAVNPMLPDGWIFGRGLQLSSPQHGFKPENMNYVKQDRGVNFKYSSSKAGVYYQGIDYANKKRHLGIISIIRNPGNLQTGLQRYEIRYFKLAMAPFLSHSINGAYTELFCGLSPELTIDRSGAYVIPWGQFAPIRSDLKDGSVSLDEGGTGMAEKWCSWCFEQIASFTT
ncbi:hypothetical protein NQ176_g10127 [Zarea fungicola]|uniref:Uncharacterized protein n=1 Tax=Zarea fungicola TaxID=93591 RepID=A0ACC1MHJ0_9HYPO|nr:hypothetical protein NQ176_g10127 [Lecanicillium fungicola]